MCSTAVGMLLFTAQNWFGQLPSGCRTEVDYSPRKTLKPPMNIRFPSTGISGIIF